MVGSLARRAALALALCGCSGAGADSASHTGQGVHPHDGSFSPVVGTIVTDCDESVPDEWWLADYHFQATESALSLYVSYWGLGSAETLVYSFPASSCQVDEVWFSCRVVDESHASEVQGIWTADTRVQVMLSWEWVGSEYSPQPCARVAQFTLAEL